MKILIAYDGSRYAEAALDDLTRAGLPPDVEAHILSVAEVWLPPSDGSVDEGSTDPYIQGIIDRRREQGEKQVEQNKSFADQASERLRGNFADWNITASATFGSPAWEILAKADEIQPDLIVTGSQGYSAVSRFLLGSISQKVLAEARHSVRVARGRINVDPSPIRIVVGFDGTGGARSAVDAVLKRAWPDETEIRLVSVTNPVSPTAFGRLVPSVSSAVEEMNETEVNWINSHAQPILDEFKAAGINCSLKIVAGSPKKALVDEAEQWNADTIFVGANAYGSKFERFILGSVSAAVAARAQCSVEVVR